MSNPVKFGVAWFRKEDWAEVKQLCAPDDLQDTYEEWLANAQKGLKAAGLAEHDIQKVILTPKVLRDWKAANGGEITSGVRSMLAATAAMYNKNTSH
jgi:hypothetical protein